MSSAEVAELPFGCQRGFDESRRIMKKNWGEVLYYYCMNYMCKISWVTERGKLVEGLVASHSTLFALL